MLGALILLLALPQSQLPMPIGKPAKGTEFVRYVKVLRVPKNGQIKLTYADLYPGERVRGGCSFTDKTKLGSYMPILEQDAEHIVIGAPVGHDVEYDCTWTVRSK